MSMRLSRSFRTLALTATLAAAAMISGCTKYYQVADPAGDRTYYTTEVDTSKHEQSGAIRFKDAKTGAQVTLQSSEVKEISKKDYEAAIGTKK